MSKNRNLRSNLDLWQKVGYKIRSWSLYKKFTIFSCGLVWIHWPTVSGNVLDFSTRHIPFIISFGCWKCIYIGRKLKDPDPHQNLGTKRIEIDADRASWIRIDCHYFPFLGVCFISLTINIFAFQELVREMARDKII